MALLQNNTARRDQDLALMTGKKAPRQPTFESDDSESGDSESSKSERSDSESSDSESIGSGISNMDATDVVGDTGDKELTWQFVCHV